jgi:hypothetical protein
MENSKEKTSGGHISWHDQMRDNVMRKTGIMGFKFKKMGV